MEETIEIEGIEIELPEGADDAMRDYAEKLAKAYESSKVKIAKYLSEDASIREMYDNPTEEDLLDAMEGVAIRVFDANNCVLEFIEWGMDDEHIVSVECEGVFEKFADHGVTIDG